MKPLAILLLLATSARAQMPLEIFRAFVGDQWVSSAKLPNGEEVRSRTVWTWGLKKRIVRMRQFVLGKQGEVQRYETVLAFDRTQKKIVYRVFSAAGLISRGTARATDDGVVLEQPKLDGFPAMRTAYSIDKQGQCVARISFRGNKEWKQRIESTLRRTKIGKYKTLRLEEGANPLQPFAHLVGSWEHRQSESGPVKAVSTGEWSLHRRLLRITDSWSEPEGLDPFWERYVSFDARSGKILVFWVSTDGVCVEGTVTMEKEATTWSVAGTDWGGEKFDVRFRCRAMGEGRQAWTSRAFEEGKWIEAPFKPWISRPRK